MLKKLVNGLLTLAMIPVALWFLCFTMSATYHAYVFPLLRLLGVMS